MSSMSTFGAEDSNMNSSAKRVEISDEVLKLDDKDSDNEDEEDDIDENQDQNEVIERARNTSARRKLGLRNAMGEYIPKDGENPLTQQALSGPGPASYTPIIKLTKSSKPTYSIVGKAKEISVDDMPGADIYDIRSNMIWKKKTLTLKAKLETFPYNRNGHDHLTCSLGGAAYKVDYHNTGKHVPRHTMGPRYGDGINIGPPNAAVQPVDTKGFFTPGPDYAPHDDRGMEKTFGLPYQRFLPKCSPGPAEYSLTTGDRGPRYSFGKRLRVLSGFKVPGPGTYEIKTAVGTGVATSLRGRQKTKKKYTGPGPNIYSVPDSFQDAPSHSMTYRPFEVMIESSPGPANYNQSNHSHRKSPAKYSCRQQCRPSFPAILNYPEYGLMKNENVGPFTYAVENGSKKNSAPSYSIGMKTTQLLSADKYPGPAHYDIRIPCRPDAFKAPEFSMGIAVENDKGSIGPGPAAYQPHSNEMVEQGYSMSSRPRQRKVRPTPAPNAYKIQKGQTSKGTANGSAATFKSRPSPYVYSGFPNLSRITT